MSSYQKSWHDRGGNFSRRRSIIGGAGYGRTRGRLWRALKRSLRWLRAGSTLKMIIKLAAIAAACVFLIGLSAFAYYSKDLPDPDKLTNRVIPESTKIYDRNGELLYDIHGEAQRTLISFDDMPQGIKQATIAIEDKDFYRHSGISIGRILYSAAFDVLTFSKSQGASTITQQLVRNALLSREKSIARKIKEIVLALEIERKYTKDEILKLYLNEIPYGSTVYGIQAAAQSFFNKNAKDLTLAESAYLAALPQSPTLLSPYGPNRDKLEDRKNTVLKLMEDQGFINHEQREAAKNEKVSFSAVKNSIKAPHFVLYIEEQLAERYGENTLQEGGLLVTTSLDMKLQRSAEEAIAENIEHNETRYGAKNASLVAIDPKTGQILAMVGSRDFFDNTNDGQVNVALRPRQPGSSFKPYVYATAFKQGLSPATMLMDVITNFGSFGGEEYVPQNYTGKNHGPVSIRQALAGSLNVPAVKTILLVGVKPSIDTAHDLGITTLQDESRYGPSLVLGGGEVRLIDHVAAFGVFANSGTRMPLVPILKVADSHNNTLEEYQEKAGQQVLDPQIAYLITSILSDNNARTFIFGAKNYLTLPDRPVAAKTGTTQEFRDAWTIGYTPQIATGVWVGNNDNSAMKSGADGSAVAAPIWNSFMKKAHAGLTAQPFVRPNGIRDIAVDTLSGKLPTAYTPSTKPEIFASFALPEQSDDLHIPVKIDKTTLLPANKNTPDENIETRLYTIFHSEKPDDPNWETPVREWAIANGYPYPDVPGDDGVGGDSNPPGTSTLYITMPEPSENELIKALPLKISVQASSADPIKNITLSFDGEKIFSNDSATASFFLDTSYPDGVHLIQARATTRSGNVSEITRRVNYAFGTSIVLGSPQQNTSTNFPLSLVARASSQVSGAAFYYQKPGGVAKKIPGPIVKTSHDQYMEFAQTWSASDKPKAGLYDVYAQTNSGEKTELVRISVP
ncbi:MAG TPA: penicillin-binding protein [Patescibacteria group bacterium]|nr:penicillin-binding protein [Patescibacteria group bacterium]